MHPNKTLLRESMKLANAVYNWNSSSNAAVENLKQLGFDANTIEQYNYTSGENTIGHVIGTKSILKSDGTETQIFAVICRGTNGTQEEWLSNFSFSNSNEFHYGFYQAAKNVNDNLSSYITRNLKDGMAISDCKIWVTGHSRGTAVANILAGRFIPVMGFKSTSIHAYTFACPNVYRGDLPNYDYIQNYNLGGDLVARVPFEEWGYSRYGRDNVYYNDDTVRGIRVIKSETMNTFCASMDGTIKYQLAIVQWMNDKFEEMEAENSKFAFDIAIGAEVLVKAVLTCSAEGWSGFLFGSEVSFTESVGEIITNINSTHRPSTYLEWIKSIT